ncbi:hypothetical protein M0R45_028472 [Rubus argutus]|uniref:Secreted protein n=1 Tax=Rubus argutus TaxID=59490 RepID=A0AAW1W5Q4_RUBAR
MACVAALLALSLALSLASIFAAPPLGVDEHSDDGACHPQASGWLSLSPLLGLSSKASSCPSSLEAALLVSPLLAQIGSRPLLVDPCFDFRTGQRQYGLGVVFSLKRSLCSIFLRSRSGLLVLRWC